MQLKLLIMIDQVPNQQHGPTYPTTSSTTTSTKQRAKLQRPHSASTYDTSSLVGAPAADIFLNKLELCASKTLEFALSPRRVWRPVQDWDSNVDVVHPRVEGGGERVEVQLEQLPVEQVSATRKGDGVQPDEQIPLALEQMSVTATGKGKAVRKVPQRKSMVDERFKLTADVDVRHLPPNLRDRPAWDNQPLVPLSKYSRVDPWSALVGNTTKVVSAGQHDDDVVRGGKVLDVVVGTGGTRNSITSSKNDSKSRMRTEQHEVEAGGRGGETRKDEFEVERTGEHLHQAHHDDDATPREDHDEAARTEALESLCDAVLVTAEAEKALSRDKARLWEQRKARRKNATQCEIDARWRNVNRDDPFVMLRFYCVSSSSAGT